MFQFCFYETQIKKLFELDQIRIIVTIPHSYPEFNLNLKKFSHITVLKTGLEKAMLFKIMELISLKSLFLPEFLD